MLRPLSSWAGCVRGRPTGPLIRSSRSKAGPVSALKSDKHENWEDQSDANLELKRMFALFFFNVLNKE